jgi:CHAD domain-containing protein
MKKKEIEEIVSDRFATIHKLSPKIVKDFDVDHIHDFRVEVKKLRGFLRLLDTEKEMQRPIIPHLLKTFYGHVGNIRNIQLQQIYLSERITDHMQLPSYMRIMEDEKLNWQRQTSELMEGKNFRDDEDRILNELPDDISKSAKKEFIEKKVRVLKEQLKEIKGDDEIHSVRKTLKDIVYNLNYINGQKELPKAISDEKDLKELTARLGDFQDQCIRVELLNPKYLARIADRDEHDRALKTKEELLREKEIMREEISEVLNKLNDQL